MEYSPQLQLGRIRGNFAKLPLLKSVGGKRRHSISSSPWRSFSINENLQVPQRASATSFFSYLDNFLKTSRNNYTNLDLSQNIKLRN